MTNPTPHEIDLAARRRHRPTRIQRRILHALGEHGYIIRRGAGYYLEDIPINILTVHALRGKGWIEEAFPSVWRRSRAGKGAVE